MTLDLVPPRTKRAPWLRERSHEADMKLPVDKTCGDCRNFPRCSALFGHIAADEVCDFSPSRFSEVSR